MAQKRLDFFVCECKQEISLRALSKHVRANRVFHSQKFIENCLKIIDLQRKQRLAWLFSEGKEAKGDEHWAIKIINGTLNFNEITFDRPRPIGQNKPSTRLKTSQDRRGKNNPSLLNKPIYDIKVIKDFATKTFKDFGDNPRRFKLTVMKIKEFYSNYGYSFVSMFTKNAEKRGHNKENLMLSYLLDKPIEWIVRNKALDRGKIIKIGQRKSDKFDNTRFAGKGKLKSRVSLSHRILFNMFLSVDSKAKIEKQIDYKKHGRVTIFIAHR